MGWFNRNSTEIAQLKAEVAELRSMSPANENLVAWLRGVASPYTTAATEDAILSVTPFWAAVRYISESIASFDLCGYRRQADGDLFEDPDHPVSRLFNGRVHPQYTTFDFLQGLVANACFGNGYARIYWDYSTMRPVALELIPSECVSVEYSQSGALYYRIGGYLNGRVVNEVLPDTDIIHIKGFTTNSVLGKQVPLIHNTNFSAAVNSQEFTNNYFGKAATPAGALVFPGFMKAEDLKRTRQGFQEAYGGISNAGETMILDGGAKFEKFSANMQEAALIDFRNLSAIDVSRITKVPVNLLGVGEHSTYSNMEQQSLDYRVHCLTPWVVKLQEEIRTKLYTTREVSTRSRFMAFDMSILMEGDMVAQAQFYGTMVEKGMMTPNEVRRRRKLNRMEGADDLFIQQNMMPMRMAQEVLMDKYSKDQNTEPGDQNTDNQQNNDNGIPQANQ